MEAESLEDQRRRDNFQRGCQGGGEAAGKGIHPYVVCVCVSLVLSGDQHCVEVELLPLTNLQDRYHLFMEPKAS